MVVNTLTFDSIYLPDGLCWKTNKTNNTFAGDETGVIVISGTTYDSTGQYKLRIIWDVSVGSLTLHKIDAEVYAGVIYKVRVTDPGAPCPALDHSSADSTLVYVPISGLASVAANITSSGSLGFCSGGSVTLQATYGVGYTYRWSDGATTRSITVTSPGNYSVTVYAGIDSAMAGPVSVTGGSSTVTSQFTLYPDSLPHTWVAINQCLGSNLTYTWYWGDSSSTTTTNPALSHTYDSAGYYNICLTISDPSGCSANYCDSAVYLFKDQSGIIQLNVVQGPSGTKDIQSSQHISYYGSAIHFSEFITTPSIVSLYDMSGRKVMSTGPFTGSSMAIPQGYVDGVYIIRLESASAALARRIVIMR
jgi:hypothetical protein